MLARVKINLKTPLCRGRWGHANMEITDQFYSNINDDDVKNRISNLGKDKIEKEQDDFARFQKFLEWERSQNS